MAEGDRPRKSFSLFSPLGRKELAGFGAEADLIPINPVIADVAGGRAAANPSWFQLSPAEWHLGTRVSSSQME